MVKAAGEVEALVRDRLFWQGRRVFVTGHTGFKGAWLCLMLRRLGAKVIGYSLDPPTSPSLFDLLGISSDIIDIRGDVCDLPHLVAAVRDHAPSIVIHMAAQPLVQLSYREPVLTYATNVMGTVNLLEAVRQTPGILGVVGVTTDKCYENREWHWGYREVDPKGGHDPYSNSKACAELVIEAYRKSFFAVDGAARPVQLASARAGNVIGGGDWALDRIVPDTIRSLIAEAPLVIRRPDAIRPWQHVLEPLGGYLMLAERLGAGERAFADAWNFGPTTGSERPVRDIIAKIDDYWGGGLRWQQDQHVETHEATFLKLDCAKAHALLKWQPQFDFDETLAMTTAWYKAFHRGEDIRALTEQQIDTYFDRAQWPER